MKFYGRLEFFHPYWVPGFMFEEDSGEKFALWRSISLSHWAPFFFIDFEKEYDSAL